MDDIEAIASIGPPGASLAQLGLQRLVLVEPAHHDEPVSTGPEPSIAYPEALSVKGTTPDKRRVQAGD
ncbi:hypothetical protein [Bradyrhizobium sp. UNPF46]|uniref:hypothetical protein n=1 Tax=Bradyrhizobium sp. UNPF46 TaxID=1141168 RepID=UPI001150E6D4|nr:hypothetical protein [Bradyrhizobium sp. UNPF46]